MAALLLALALLAPIIGPNFDHHFAERFPGHGHVYLGPAPAAHVHVFDRPHDEGQLVVDRGAALSHIVAVFDLDAGAQSGTAAFRFTGVLETGQIQAGDPSGPLFEIGSNSHALSSATVPPPEQPPKV